MTVFLSMDVVSFIFFILIVRTSSNDEGTDAQPFLFRKEALTFDSEIELKFYVEGIRYWYKLIINPEKVCNESLYVYLTNRPTRIFSREDANGVSKLNFNPAVVKLTLSETEVIAMNCMRNMSVLAVLKKVNVSATLSFSDACMGRF